MEVETFVPCPAQDASRGLVNRSAEINECVYQEDSTVLLELTTRSMMEVQYSLSPFQKNKFPHQFLLPFTLLPSHFPNLLQPRQCSQRVDHTVGAWSKFLCLIVLTTRSMMEVLTCSDICKMYSPLAV